MTPWAILRIEPTGDERDIKRAYARLLKSTRPEDDPDAFQELRDAYEYALNLARYAPAPELEAADEVAHVAEVAQAPQLYEDPSFGPFALARWQPVEDAPELARPDPVAEAERLWMRFLDTAAFAPRTGLTQLADGDDLLDLEVRERFELCAVGYAASAACPAPAREAIAEFFQWQTDAALIARVALDETREMLARLRAQQSLALFQRQGADDPAVVAILSDKAGRNFGRTIDGKFTRSMQDLIAAIRFHHPEMLHFELNHAVFSAWERRVAGRRFFLHTAGYAFAAGVVLWIAALIALIDFDVLSKHGVVSFLGAQLVAFSLIGWLTEYPPAAFSTAVSGWRDGTGFLLHDLRHRPAWQFGWIGLYVAAAACLAVPAAPLALRVAVTAALLVALGGAILANWGLINRWGFLLVATAGLGAGLMMADGTVDGYSLWAWVLAVTCALLLMCRGGFDFCQWLGVPDRRLPLVRGVWLTGAANLIAAIHLVPLTHPGWIVVAFLWLTAGMLLSNPSIPHFVPFLVAAVVRSILIVQAPVALPAPLPALTIFLIAVAAFMAVNMLRAATHQTQFS